MFSSFNTSRAFGKKGISYLAGVVARRYNAGYFADDVNWFASRSPSTTSIQVESDATSGNIAFIRESIIHVAVGATFRVVSGTQLNTNVLGLF